MDKKTHILELIKNVRHLLWERRDSNPRPSACKADALNQLSYAPFNFGIANVRLFSKSANFYLKDFSTSLEMTEKRLEIPENSNIMIVFHYICSLFRKRRLYGTMFNGDVLVLTASDIGR